MIGFVGNFLQIFETFLHLRKHYTKKHEQRESLSLNSSHFDKFEHSYKFTKEILETNNLVYSTHFG